MPAHAPSFGLPRWATDVLIALFVTIMQVQGTIVRNAADPGAVLRPLDDLGHLGYALLVVSGAVVAVRHRWPLFVFTVTALCSVVYYTFDYPDGPAWLGLFVAIYTLTAFGDGRRSILVAGAGITLLAIVWLVAAANVEPRAAIGWVYFRIGAAVMSAALGESVRSRRVIAADALRRAELAERTREEEARRRVDEERLRIAREVHDTVAHAVATINVQAGVTAHVLDKRPERAREALEAIERTSGRALQEMRTILGVLRDEQDGRVPHPGVTQLDELVMRTREAGIDVLLDADTPPSPVASAVDSAVYRIVQESLTNVIRHVGPTRVVVSVAYDADTVNVHITDDGPLDGPPPRTDRAGTGRGLVGMRERCRLLGGHLDARPSATAGFEVAARLPLTPTRALA